MKRIFATLSLAIIVSCSSSKEVDPSPEKLTVAEQKGIAIGTITFEGDVPMNDIYRFFYNATSGDKKFQKANTGKIIIRGRNDNNKTFNGDFNNKHSYLFIIEREPGNYAFTQYSFLDHKGPTGAVSISKEFEIPFEIKKGEVSYVGELDYVDQAAKGSPRIFVADYQERDLEAFKKKYPDFNWNDIKNRVPKTGNTGEGIIDFRN